MDSLPHLNSQDLVGLTPGSENFDDFGNVDPSHLQDIYVMPYNTLDVVPLQEFKPVSPRGPPVRTVTPGSANFCVEVASTDIKKRKFLYSHKIGRIYVDKDRNFSVSFNWDVKQTLPDMYVRATVVFSDVEQAEKRVERCVTHYHETDTLPDQIAKNVLHSSREIGTQGVYYCGDVSTPDSWYSVLVHHHKTTPEPCTHAYKFTCKNSCVSGINRRSIAIIFTLEDQSGEVYGRQKVGVKVCACPGRDIKKDEEAEDVVKCGGKRRVTKDINENKTKMIKLESQEVQDNMVMLPPGHFITLKLGDLNGASPCEDSVQIPVEVNALISGLRTMIDNMSNVSNHNPEYVEMYTNSIAELKKVKNHIEGTPPK